jgi:MerR family transcriptional regulator/heat shock protein HspR
MPTLEEYQGAGMASGQVFMQDLFFISMAARMLACIHRRYGSTNGSDWCSPTRTIGSMRVYSRDELERLRLIKRMVDDGGINLAGVQRLLDIAEIINGCGR